MGKKRSLDINKGDSTDHRMSFKEQDENSGYYNPAVTMDDDVIPQTPNSVRIRLNPLNLNDSEKMTEPQNSVIYNSAPTSNQVAHNGPKSLGASSDDLLDSKLDWDQLEDMNFVIKSVTVARAYISHFFKIYHTWIKWALLAFLTIAYFVYFGFAIANSWESDPSYCQGSRFLFILTVFAVVGVLYFCILKHFFGETIYEHCIKPITNITSKIWQHRYVQWIFYALIVAAIVTFFIIDTANNRQRLVSAAGVLILTLFGFIFSKYPGKIIWRQVFWGLGFQFVFALLILRWNVGQEIFQCLGDKIAAFLTFTDAGSAFVFNYLVTGQLQGWNMTNITVGNETIEFDGNLPQQAGIFAFKVLTVIIFFSFCISILYFYGIMQWIVTKLGWLLQVTIGTTAAESINAAANIFVGQTEAPLIIRPFLPVMTKSELHAVMTGGFATIAGGVLAAYINFGVSASHLLSASVMSAPAALGFSKLFYPETEASQTTVDNIKIDKGTERNALEAAANGASNAITLVANVVANLIAFIAFIAFLNSIVQWFATLIGYDFVTFEWLLSQLFIPLAYIMGVEWDECDEVARLIGLKTVVNEFVAYAELAKMIKLKELSARSQAIATYALCGFSNISSIGIQLGGLGAMAPERKSDLAEIGLRALISGSVACFLTACIAGALINE